MYRRPARFYKTRKHPCILKASSAEKLATTAHAISLVRTRSQTVFSTNKIQQFHGTTVGTTGGRQSPPVLHYTVSWQKPARRKNQL